MYFKKTVFLIFVLSICFKNIHADEGMWIPLFIKNNEAHMKSLGMRISAEDIYSINNNSLKDAIVLFGRGCTGELISDEGLLLTNHHCGYGRIQAHSSLENDYLKHGFWAQSKKEELPNNGLTVSFLIRMEDVTEGVLEGVDNNMNQNERNSLIEKNIKRITKEAVLGTHYEAIIKDFYAGNQYFLFINEVFEDVRLVGAPPSSIGKFGGDTDNWMWPRHTGDFALFRIYANKDNKPAKYAADNVPYKPKKFLPISLKGTQKGDFTFVYGFPGSTNQYATSYEVDIIKNIENPISIKMRDLRLSIIGTDMKESDAVRIQYASKQASIANGWKKWIGENRGLTRLNTIENKKLKENAFLEWAASNPAYKEQYAGLMPLFKDIFEAKKPAVKAYIYFREAGLGSEIIRFAYSYNNLLRLSETKNPNLNEINAEIDKLKKAAEGHFKNYNFDTDKKLFQHTIKEYYNSFDLTPPPTPLDIVRSKFENDFEKYSDDVFSKTIFASIDKTMAFLNNFTPKKHKTLKKDPFFILANSMFNAYFNDVYPELIKNESKLDSLNRIFMQGLMAFESNKVFYPDANLTLRVTYGIVSDYYPMDAVKYHHYTTIDGIFEKETLGYDDYEVYPTLRKLYENKDYGRYAVNGTLPVCFIASNHTTGGNSGSPVLNADGHLIGINFDRNWEGTMSDLNYDPEQCRNISLDARYILFIIDKFANAQHILNELVIIE